MIISVLRYFLRNIKVKWTTPEEAEKRIYIKTVTEKTLSKRIGQGFFLSKKCYKSVLTTTAIAYIFRVGSNALKAPCCLLFDVPAVMHLCEVSAFQPETSHKHHD